MGEAIGLILLYAIPFLIAVLITRLVFSIPTIVQQLRIQSNILQMMAEKSGVPRSDIEEMLRKTKP